jgi:hypothetical protein
MVCQQFFKGPGVGCICNLSDFLILDEDSMLFMDKNSIEDEWQDVMVVIG